MVAKAMSGIDATTFEQLRALARKSFSTIVVKEKKILRWIQAFSPYSRREDVPFVFFRAANHASAITASRDSWWSGQHNRLRS